MSEHIDCRAAMQRLWDYLDGELTEARMAEIDQHLKHCAACLPHAEFAQRFLRSLQQTREDRPMPAELKRRVMSLLEEEAGA